MAGEKLADSESNANEDVADVKMSDVKVKHL